MSEFGYLQPAFIGGSMSGGEILLVLLALLLLFGSKNLPSIARNIGKSLESFRRASREVTDEIMRADILEDRPAITPPKSAATTPVSPAEAEPPPVIHPTENAVGRNETTSSSSP